VSLFAQKLSELQDEKIAATEEKSRIRTENAVLQERVHLLEEQLHATEQRWAEKLNEEKAKAREMTQRTDRERQLEAEKEALRLVIFNSSLFWSWLTLLNKILN